MIETIKQRIKSCRNRIYSLEKTLPESLEEKMHNAGFINGLKDELRVLNELLVTAEKLQDLERSA